MSSGKQQILTKVLDDLCSRFIINIPAEQRDDLVRVLFAIELAHWFFIDFYCEDGNNLHRCNIKDFAQQIFQHCPFLRNYVHNLDNILSEWRGYKLSVPTYGAVLIDPTYEHVLLVQGFYNRESWGFPKGKVQENESPLKCAIREVMEEVGFDMKDRAFDDQYLEHDLNGQLIRLYVVREVPLDTKFGAKTKNEIKEMRWFSIADLPCHKHDTTPQVKLNLNPKAFFMVIPFIKDLRRWISQECGIYLLSNGDFDSTNVYVKHYEQTNLPHHYRQQSRRRTVTYPNHTRQMSIQQRLLGIDQQTSSFIRNDISLLEQRKPSSKIIANLTLQSIDEQKRLSSSKLQRQLRAQDTIQRHFSEILKNDSITVTDNTSITETLLMRENNFAMMNISYITQLTPPPSNDDENKHPSSAKNYKGKRSSYSSIQYRVLSKNQSNELDTQMKNLQSNNDDVNVSDKIQRHRRYTDRYSINDITHQSQAPFLNLTNNTFRFRGPRCWIQFRLNRSEVFRCLHE